MSKINNSSNSNKRILFFGRDKCNATQKLLNDLITYEFDVTYIKSSRRGENLSDDILLWEGEYIICFRSLFILPKILIEKANIAAINFHPGPPEYPGSGCINFALYDEVSQYGVTAHIMNELVDNGQILEVRNFPVTSSDNLSSVLARTHSELLNLCADFISGIYSQGEIFIKDKITKSETKEWNGKARHSRELDALQRISVDISEKELKRIIRATYIKEYPPKIELHGFKFILEHDKS